MLTIAICEDEQYMLDSLKKKIIKYLKERDISHELKCFKSGDVLLNSCQISDNDEINYGIGLSNIKSVVDKYGGALNTEIIGEVFRLNALFIISQHL